MDSKPNIVLSVALVVLILLNLYVFNTNYRYLAEYNKAIVFILTKLQATDASLVQITQHLDSVPVKAP